ncbi:MAG: L17 family ribosomal protein, partial [Kiritimatiellae bacterium]|nr:L17 family ribosomal protein [Kiritimatiellia bacterium]
MRHNRIAKKFGRSTSHRKALMSSLVTNLIVQSSIKTTLPKAKQARRDAEKMVTLARKGTLAARRLAASRLQ